MRSEAEILSTHVEVVLKVMNYLLVCEVLENCSRRRKKIVNFKLCHETRKMPVLNMSRAS